VGVGNGSLKVDDADKGYTGGPKEREWLLITNYQGAATKYE